MAQSSAADGATKLDANRKYHMNMHVTEIDDHLLALKTWQRAGGSLWWSWHLAILVA